MTHPPVARIAAGADEGADPGDPGLTGDHHPTG